MTRSVVNGSPASAIVGGVIDGSGRPAGAGRSGPSPMARDAGLDAVGHGVGHLRLVH